MYLASKTVCYKLYDIQLIDKKDLSLDFDIDLPVSTNSKNESYDSILVIVDHLTKIVYYELIKVMTNISDLAKVIINIVIYYYKVLESIVEHQDLLFISNF